MLFIVENYNSCFLFPNRKKRTFVLSENVFPTVIIPYNETYGLSQVSSKVEHNGGLGWLTGKRIKKLT